MLHGVVKMLPFPILRYLWSRDVLTRMRFSRPPAGPPAPLVSGPILPVTRAVKVCAE
ncbi:MAG: hypothetical protein AAFZ80_06545 [Cyanobacteria bacterium P01_A01_bin.105]